MGVVHIWALALAPLAAGLPVVIHLLTRPRPVRVPLSTIRFVQEAIRQRRARHRLRDILILAARTLAVLLIAVAFARPLWQERPLISPNDTTTAVRVVLLDASQSMAARVGGIARFERARAAAAEYLAYRDGLQANLIVAGAVPRPVFERCSMNLAALREELARAQVLPERFDVTAALNAAAELLANSGASADARRELVVISDFQKSNWNVCDFAALPRGTVVELETVAPEATPANLAVLRAGTVGRLESGKEGRLEVEVGNYGDTRRPIEVAVSLGETAIQLSGSCEAGARTVLTAELAPTTGGWQTGAARLLNVTDALAEDDTCPLAAEIRPATTCALITRQRSEEIPSSSYFLERGLVPAAPGAKVDRRVVRVAPAQVDRESLAAADVLIVDHPGKLEPPAIALLTSLITRGRPLLYVAAEPIDATNLRLLAEAAGTAVRMPVEFSPPAVGQTRQAMRLGEIRSRTAPFDKFGEELNALVTPLDFGGGLATRPLPEGLADDVRAAYSDGSAFLTISTCGSAALAVLNADLSYSDLPRSPLFVPLLAELNEALLQQRRAPNTVLCGEPLRAYLPAEAGAAGGLRLEGPANAAAAGELVDAPTGVLGRWTTVGAPGVYRVLRDEPVYAIAATLPAEESDLRTVDPTTLSAQAGGGLQIHCQTGGGGAPAQDTGWIWPAVAGLSLVLVEILLLKLYRT